MNKLIAPLRPNHSNITKPILPKNRLLCHALLICAYADNLDCFLLVCYKQKKCMGQSLPRCEASLLDFFILTIHSNYFFGLMV